MNNRKTNLPSVSMSSPARHCAGRSMMTAFSCVLVASILSLVLGTVSTSAQQFPAIRFNFSQARITVPVGATNSTTLTNFVNLSYGATNADFDVTGLPPGASAVLTDTNGTPQTSISTDTNLWLTINTTNIPQGLYIFRLNAGGFDTNGLPVTNSFPFVLQSAHIWNGALDASNSWADTASWLGGAPGAADDVVFTDIGAQTNGFLLTGGPSFTNSWVTTSTTVGSLRFAQIGLTNTIATNPAPVYNHLHIAANQTLTISGSNGFSLLRDAIETVTPLGALNITVSGESGSKLIISNKSSSVSTLLSSTPGVSTLNMSNLNNMVVNVLRMGIADYQLYPNYRDLNNALNAGRDTNTYNGRPDLLTAHVYLPKTNLITANYKDPENYTNQLSRQYAFTVFNNEQRGVSSGTAQNFILGISNAFYADSICFYGANANGTAQFATTNSTAVFRNTNGTSAISVFSIGDDGGTNAATSNVKGTLDLSLGAVDLLADRFYIGRDRETISTNNGTPNIEGTFSMGRGKAVVNTAILGFQEHMPPDWTVLGDPQPYLNHCSGTLTLTTGAVFVVNGDLTLGYTADINNPTHAVQSGTKGTITVGGGSALNVSNIICDGGLNYYDALHRANTISILGGGTLVVSNTIGGDNYTGSQYSSFLNTGSPCLPLDSLAMAPGATLTLFVAPGKTNAYVRNFSSPGPTPGILKIASLPVFPVYPTNIPLIKYDTATPFVAADMSAIGGSVQGFILNNASAKTIDLFLTTNASKTVTWTGASGDQSWNVTSLNWLATNGVTTNFSMGDIAIFNDNATVTNIFITDLVVPNQATNGVVISNSVNQYTFLDGGGFIGGTAKIVKQGTNLLTFSATGTGPITVLAGEMDVNGGRVASITAFSNVVLNLTNSGTVNGNILATNTTILVEHGSTINGGVTVSGGMLFNDGEINLPATTALLFIVNSNAVATNYYQGKIQFNGAGNPAGQVFAGSTMVNLGTIIVAGSRFFVDGLYYGGGDLSFYDNTFSASASQFGRLQINNTPTATFGIGPTPSGTISNMFVGARLDMHQSNPQNLAAKFLLDVDAGTTNCDTITSARWNNIGCIWVINNINTSAPFTSGESFRPLVNYNGTSIKNFVDTPSIYPLMQPTVPGPGLQWNLSDIQTYGTFSITNCGMVWDGNGNLSWDTNGSTGNWKSSQVFSNYAGAVFDDSASGSTTITLGTFVAPVGFSTVTVTNLDNSVTTTTNTPSFSPGMVVSNNIKDYTIAGPGKITGMTSIYKTGPGTLTLLSTNNDFTGGMVIEGGTVAYTNVAALGFVGNIPGQRPAYNQIIIDNGTLKNFGTTNQSLGWAVTLNDGGGTFEVSSNSTVLAVGGGSLNILGSGGLTKTGAGVLLLPQAGDNYANGTILNEGTLRLTAAALGTGPVTLNGGAFEWTNSPGLTITNTINVAGSGIAFNLLGISTNISNGSWTGAGSVTFTTTNSAQLFSFSGDLSGFGGTISFGTSSNMFRFNHRTNDSPCTGSASANFDLGTGAAALLNYNGAGLTYNLGSLSGGLNTILAGRFTNNITATNPGTTYSIGGNNSSTTFSGRITNGVSESVSVVKVGTGRLLLNGVNIYSGPTTVSNGILGGTGSIASPLTVKAGGTLSPGASIGTFTVSNSAVLNGTVFMELNRGLSPGASNDLVVVTGTVVSTNGTLIVTNVGPDIYNGSTFKLFNKPVSGFTSVLLPVSNPSNTSTYVWTNNVAFDGTITLISGGISPVNPNPTNITVSVTGGVMTLTWPADHTGWSLQVQTNPLSVGLSTNWYTIPGSSTSNSQSFMMDITQGNIYYRMVLP